MENYRSAEKALKVGVENIWVLHHNIISKNFPSDHENMDAYYNLEVSITEALEEYDAIPAKTYPKVESYTLVQEMFNRIIVLLDEAKIEEGVPDYIKNLIEEWQQKFDLEANYKIAHLLAAEREAETE